MEADIKTQKMSIMELLSTACRVYATNFSSIFGIIVCVLIPNDIIRALIRNATLFENLGKINYVANSLLGSMFDLLIGTIATIGIAIIVDQSLQGITLSWQEALKRSLSKWGAAVIVSLLARLMILVASFFLIVPGIMLLVDYIFVTYIVALRADRKSSALNYSEELVKGQWWRIFGFLVILVIIGIILNAVIISLIPLFKLNIPNNYYVFIGYDFILSFSNVATTILFLNCDYLHRSKVVGGSTTSAIVQEG